MAGRSDVGHASSDMEWMRFEKKTITDDCKNQRLNTTFTITSVTTSISTVSPAPTRMKSRCL